MYRFVLAHGFAAGEQQKDQFAEGIYFDSSSMSPLVVRSSSKCALAASENMGRSAPDFSRRGLDRLRINLGWSCQHWAPQK
jgi:hypothetical protein